MLLLGNLTSSNNNKNKTNESGRHSQSQFPFFDSWSFRKSAINWKTKLAVYWNNQDLHTGEKAYLEDSARSLQIQAVTRLIQYI